jgi:D-sedoheptulose 7-phosphate isomerase
MKMMENQETSTNTLAWIHRRLESSIAVIQAMISQPILEQIAQAVKVLAERLSLGNQLLIFGNGGSAADAQHIATELVASFYLQRKALPALALTTNTSTLTAIGNDHNFDLVFSRQIEAYGKPGDVAIGISTSGRSRNVFQGLKKGRELGLYTVALTGANGKDLQSTADICISVPSQDTPRIQESHILIGHILCEYVEATLFEAALNKPGKGE